MKATLSVVSLDLILNMENSKEHKSLEHNPPLSF
jgi:hypothetical protein